MMTEAQEQYRLRLLEQQKRIQRLTKTDRLLSASRGILFVLFVALFFFVIERSASYLWTGIPALLFAVLVIYHERVINRRDHAARIASFYTRGMARLEHRWMGSGNRGEQFKDPLHPYSEDLDLFGSGSLFELLCIARTQSGEETLAGWLLHPASPEQIDLRQAAVKDLRSRLDFREQIATQGADVRNRMHPQALVAWSEMPPVPISKILRIATTLSVLSSLTALYGWAWLGWGWHPFAIVLIVQVFLLRHLTNRVQSITRGAEGAHQELQLLSKILDQIEREQFESSHLKTIQDQMKMEGVVPSQQIKRMGTLLNLLDWQRNQLFAPVAILLLWQAHLAFAIERWRNRYGSKIPMWIHSVGKIEALNCFAAYIYENPDAIFPEIVENEMIYHGVDLGHPLIPDPQCVRNSIQLDSQHRLKIVSGSNMSGKSTFLRTIGINAALALAGSAVRAKSLRLSPISVGASIHILDSLQAGSSRFYAEITRLRQLMDLAQTNPPLLFLLDEILHGTNSADRLIGAEAIVQGFLKRDAIGLLTTHDLALANLANKLGSIADNIHFQDHIEDGRIAFDYRVHPGIVQKSNAIELMRAVGLEV